MVRTRTSTAGNDGFTLLELIVVLVIAGLSAAVVFFSIGRLHEKTLFNQDARKVYQTLRKARGMALAEKRDVIVSVDERTGGYGIGFNEGEVFSTQGVGRGTEITGTDVVFYSKGNSSGGVIVLRNGKGQGYSIEVSKVLGTASIKRL